MFLDFLVPSLLGRELLTSYRKWLHVHTLDSQKQTTFVGGFLTGQNRNYL